MAGQRDKPEEIVMKLRQAEVLQGQGVPIADAVRQISVMQQTCYRWRKQYGGMNRDQLKRLKELETENQRLRRAVSDLTLDKLILKEAARGTGVRNLSVAVVKEGERSLLWRSRRKCSRRLPSPPGPASSGPRSHPVAPAPCYLCCLCRWLPSGHGGNGSIRQHTAEETTPTSYSDMLDNIRRKRALGHRTSSNDTVKLGLGRRGALWGGKQRALRRRR